MKPHNVFKRRVNESGGAVSVAGRLKCSVQMVRFIATGERKPGRDLSLRIEDTLGIPAREWGRQ